MGSHNNANLFIAMLILIFAISSAQAQSDSLAEREQRTDGIREVAVPLAYGAASATGYLSRKSYKTAGNIRNANGQSLMDPTGSVKVMSNGDISSVASQIQPGDEIHIKYQLNLKESRTSLIREMKDQIEELVENDEEEEAAKVAKQMRAIRRGAPIRSVQKEITVGSLSSESATETAAKVRQELQMLRNKGKPIVSVSRVPENVARRARWLSRAGGVLGSVGAVSGVIATEEIFWGYGSARLADIIGPIENPLDDIYKSYFAR